MEVYVSIIDYPHAPSRDLEILDSCPTPTFLADLVEIVRAGRADRVEIRAGNVNGGDSVSLFLATNGAYSISGLMPAQTGTDLYHELERRRDRTQTA